MMFKVQSLLLALLLQNASANSFLRTIRRLSQEHFLSYEPITTVTDHAAIDLDQKALEAQLALGTDQGRQAALKVYVEGAFSDSYAEITLSAPMPLDVGKGVTVFGLAADGTMVRGKTMTATKSGDTVIEVGYHATPVQARWTNCHVGGNPEPNTVGCLAPDGNVEIGELGEYPYTYNPQTSNFNARTLQGFSVQAKEKMYDCAACPYATYQKFYSYYGAFDYANQWVLAAFNKQATNFAKGNADFAAYGMEGTTEAIKKGTAYMSVWMYVIRELEDAVDDCNSKCTIDECNDDQVHAWDEAVAFYVGSEAKSSGEGGYMPYTLGQKRCSDFGTCLTTGTEVGMASVNSEIFKHFRQGKQNILLGNCAAAKEDVASITPLMAVPLIQGTLRYAYAIDKQNDTREKAEAEGATFAAAVLPLLNACSEADADIVYDNMRVGNGGTASFPVVKEAFEKNYECLGVTCAHVGGLVDEVTEGYLAGAEPCGYKAPEKESSSSSSTSTTSSTTTSATQATGGDNGPNVGLAVGLTVGIVALLIVVALLISRKNEKEFDGVAEPEVA